MKTKWSRIWHVACGTCWPPGGGTHSSIDHGDLFMTVALCWEARFGLNNVLEGITLSVLEPLTVKEDTPETLKVMFLR